jgi:hypothetical protein
MSNAQDEESLMRRKTAIAAVLKRALESSDLDQDARLDLEVRRRIEGILKDRAQRQMRLRLERLKAAVANGGADQVAELLAGWPEGFEEAACWDELQRLLARLVELNHKQGGPISPTAWRAHMVKERPAGPLRVVAAARVTEHPGGL